MNDAISELTGLLVTMVGGLCVKPLLEVLREKIKVPEISDVAETQAAWEKLISHPDASGRWVGTLERLVFFAALHLQPREAAAAIGVWLAFKVAAKWEAWNHMAHVPERIRGVPPLRLAVARRIWAAQGYATLVVGTSANFLLAACGAALAYYGWVWLYC